MSLLSHKRINTPSAMLDKRTPIQECCLPQHANTEKIAVLPLILNQNGFKAVVNHLILTLELSKSEY